MGKLQQAIGETSASVNGKNNHFDVSHNLNYIISHAQS